MLLLAFDAGNPALVRAYAAAGHLPNFARVLSSGATAIVEHEPGLFVGSIWPTALTGVTVARHGFYTGIRPAPFAYHYEAAGVNADPFWVDVARSGQRIAVVDAPFFRAVEGLDGVQLFEWGCHDRYYGPHSAPVDFLGDIVRDVGRHPIGMMTHEYERFAPCDWPHRSGASRTPDELVDFVQTITAAIDRRKQMSKYLLGQGPFDLIVDVIAETHSAGHHLWHLHDPTHPQHDAALVERLGGDPLLPVYREMDDLLGIHLDALDDDDSAFVFLSHGMQSHFDGTQVLDEVLWRLDQAYRGLPTPWIGPATSRLANAVRRVPGPAKATASAAVRALVRRRLGSRPFDPTPVLVLPPPDERLWYQLDNNTVSGAVRLNRIGREPSGLLGDPLSDHATRWLDDELRTLVNVDTGESVVTDVYRSDTLYARRDDDGLPDVLIEWNRDRPIERVWSPTIGLICRPYDGTRTGDHDRFGELIALGPKSVPGRRQPIRGVDVAPTVAAAAGVFLRGRDGRAIPELVPFGGSLQSSGSDAITVLERAGSTSSSRRARDRDVEATAVRRDLLDLRHELYGLAAAHHATRELAEAARSSAATAVDVIATTAWIRKQDVPTALAISIIMPTRQRLDRLRDTVASVLAQTYPNFQLIIVDDESDDGTAAWLATVHDHRVATIRNDVRRGEGGSRNVGLDMASGDVIVFLDDDNTFEPEWLRSVAWLFQSQPATGLAYGARLVDDVRRHHEDGEGGLPWFQLNDWDRVVNAERCLIDVNVLAHRRGPTRFDPDLELYTDWDYLLALARDVDPVRLPVLATHYTTDAAGRATIVIGDRKQEMYNRVRARWDPDG